MHWVRRILLLVLIAVLVVSTHLFVRDNEQTVDLDFLGFRVEAVEVWLVLLGSFVAGLVLASVVAVFRGAKLRMVARRYRKAARDLSTEVHELRNLPLAPHAVEPGEDEPQRAPGDGLERGG